MSGSVNDHPHDRLSEYLDDQLSIEERDAIDRHLASCEDCRSQLDALRRLARAIAEESVPPPPVDLHEKIGRRLDEATVIRPRRWRFALPATIAATISAIGILIAVQWREGRLTPPSAHEAARPSESVADEKAGDEVAQAPAPLLRDEGVARKAKERTDADAAGAREKLDWEVQSEPEPKDSRAVVGGVVGSREAGSEEVTGGAHENRARAVDASQNQPAVSDEAQGRLFQKQSNVAAAPPAPAAKLEATSVCADRWSDSGARGTWEVPDPVATARELDTIARDAGGMGLFRGIDDGRPYLLIVPRSRYAEVFFALRARGVAGLVDPPVLATGDDCTALSITIVLAR